jgi:hypothetical protein
MGHGGPHERANGGSSSYGSSASPSGEFAGMFGGPGVQRGPPGMGGGGNGGMQNGGGKMSPSIGVGRDPGMGGVVRG